MKLAFYVFASLIISEALIFPTQRYSLGEIWVVTFTLTCATIALQKKHQLKNVITRGEAVVSVKSALMSATEVEATIALASFSHSQLRALSMGCKFLVWELCDAGWKRKGRGGGKEEEEEEEELLLGMKGLHGIVSRCYRRGISKAQHSAVGQNLRQFPVNFVEMRLSLCSARVVRFFFFLRVGRSSTNSFRSFQCQALIFNLIPCPCNGVVWPR